MKYSGWLKIVWPFLSDKSTIDKVLQQFFSLNFLISLTLCFFITGYLRSENTLIDPKYFLNVCFIPQILCVFFRKKFLLIQSQYNQKKFKPYSFNWFFLFLYPVFSICLCFIVIYLFRDQKLVDVFSVIFFIFIICYAYTILFRLILDVLFMYEVFEPKVFGFMTVVVLCIYATQIKYWAEN